MIITRVDDKVDIKYAYLNIFPDQFKSNAEKLDNKTWIKNAMDYFSNVAYSQYRRNRDTFVKNYPLVKGILTWDDFYNGQPKEVTGFIDQLMADTELPEYIRHYPILNPPLNTLVGELSKRPDVHRVRAMDDESKSEEFQYKTDILNQLVIQKAKERILYKMAQNGINIEEVAPEEVQNLTMEHVQSELTDYTSTAEEWANNIIQALKVELNLKDKSEDAYRDLLIANREFFHLKEDASKLGFNVVNENPKNIWELSTPDKKYTSDPSGRNEGAYAAGTVHVMEISQIIEEFPKLSEKEIKHLTDKALQDYGLIDARESNIGKDNTGIDSIQYDNYSRLIAQERMIAESEMKENKDELKDWLGLTNNTSTFGYKYTVVRAYWIGKTKVGQVNYYDENGDVQTKLVDENYKSSPNQIGEVEWGWVNQWYQGYKIGSDIYHVEPLMLLDYCPIIGVKYEIKNTEGRSLVDLMKPYQMIYNVAMNQLWRLLEKEIGVVYNVKLRKIPIPKDGDPQDAIDVWEEEARKRGVVFEDDSPENMKAPMSNTDNSRPIDLTRTAEIQSRYELAVRMKLECWELVGMNRQRLGSSMASSTATANENDLAQSFAQTEPYFAQHEYILDRVYQAIIDAAQYVQTQKPYSTISYINSEGRSAFLQVPSEDIKFRDLRIFSVSRAEDQRLFNELRALSQPMLQNGVHAYDVSEMYTTNSIRTLRRVLKNVKEESMRFAQQQQQNEQQALEQAAQIEQAKLKEVARQKEIDRINENYNKEQDRVSKERIAIISALGFGKVQGEDSNANAIPDVLESTRLSMEQGKSQKYYEIKLRELAQKEKELAAKRDLDLKKLEVDKENMKNDKEIALINARNKAKAAKSKK
jgi:hypothetical protein